MTPPDEARTTYLGLVAPEALIGLLSLPRYTISDRYASQVAQLEERSDEHAASQSRQQAIKGDWQSDRIPTWDVLSCGPMPQRKPSRTAFALVTGLVEAPRRNRTGDPILTIRVAAHL